MPRRWPAGTRRVPPRRSRSCSRGGAAPPEGGKPSRCRQSAAKVPEKQEKIKFVCRGGWGSCGCLLPGLYSKYDIRSKIDELTPRLEHSLTHTEHVSRRRCARHFCNKNLTELRCVVPAYIGIYLKSGRREQAHRRRGSAPLLVLEGHRRGEVELVQHGKGVAPGIGVGEDLPRTRSCDGAQARRPLEEKLLNDRKKSGSASDPRADRIG